MEKGTLLLASSGKEFTKPTGILANSNEVKKARREAMGRLGLDFLESVGGADDMDLDKELADEDGDVEMAQPQPTIAIKTETVKMEDDTALSSPTDDLVDIKVKKEKRDRDTFRESSVDDDDDDNDAVIFEGRRNKRARSANDSGVEVIDLTD